MKSFMGLEAPDINILSLGLTMFFITAVPVGIGLLMREKNKYYADKLEPKASKISTILFAIIILGALLSEWETFINNFVLLGPAIVLLILTMLIKKHLNLVKLVQLKYLKVLMYQILKVLQLNGLLMYLKL